MDALALGIVALPYGIARFNKRYTNQFIEPVVRRLPGFTVIHHHGRTTGKAYQTPLYSFTNSALPDELLIALTYGPQADWIQNVLTGGGQAERNGIRHAIANVEIVQHCETVSVTPRAVRVALTIIAVTDFARITLEPSASTPTTTTSQHSHG